MRRAQPSRPSLDGRLELGHNALNALRLVLATMVIVGHVPRLSGQGSDPALGVVKLGVVAVGGFFAISGYLVTNSRLRSSGGTYMLRRFARIYPGYWLCLAITAFPLAWIVSVQRGGWNLHDAVAAVVFNGTLVTVHGTVGATLAGAPDPSTWNGSLWTLPVELLCYIGIAVALTVSAARQHLRELSVAAFVGLVAISTLSAIHNDRISGLLYVMTFFSCGVLLYAWRSSIRIDWRLAAASVIAFVLAYQSTSTVALGSLPFAYLCLWLGAEAPERLKAIGAHNDISYGVYLYGWPVQQTLTAYGVGSRHGGFAVYAVASVVGVLPLAWLSWLAVERPTTHAAKRWIGRQRTVRVARPHAPSEGFGEPGGIAATLEP